MIGSFDQNMMNNKFGLIELKSSYVSVKVKGTGNRCVFSKNEKWFKSEKFPDEIHINDIKQKSVERIYYLNQEENNIKLIWNKAPSYAQCMLCECNDIIAVDFSNFDSSQVTIVAYMFYKTWSLISLF